MKHDLQYVKEKLVILATINVFQPIKIEKLITYVENIDKDRLKIILNDLLVEKRIIVEDDHFRVTFGGLNTLLPDKGRIFRDLQRMEYTIQLSKKRGKVID